MASKSQTQNSKNLIHKMLKFALSFSSLQLNTVRYLSLMILSIYNVQISATSNHSDHYLLNCGLATASTTSPDGQTWRTDHNSTFSPLAAFSTTTTSATSSAPTQVPCINARLFNSSFTYSFPVSPGPKFVRLHFCPATYGSTPPQEFFLSLHADGGAGPFTLLSNFSAYLYQLNPSSSNPITEEFLLSVNTSRLNLTFFPTSPNSLAFVNGIEIVSVPDRLYNDFDHGPCGSVKDVSNLGSAYSALEPVALQTVVRLNVGGKDVQLDNNNGDGMLRNWINDQTYMTGNFTGAIPNRSPIKIKYNESSLPEYTAPDIVYWTARVMGSESAEVKMRENLTWAIRVQPGFDYLVRLHFCEIDSDITGSNQRVFNIFINDQMAERGADVMALTNEVWAAPVCKDYIVTSYGDELSLVLHPDIEQKPWQQDAILNGLEVFKMSLWNRSLAAPNPPVNMSSDQQNAPTCRNTPSNRFLPLIRGVIGGTTTLSCILVFAICWWRFTAKHNKNRANSSNTGSKKGEWRSKAIINSRSSSLPSHLCKRFTLHQIKLATRNFDEEMVIGIGGFGKVYKGSIPLDGRPGTTTVAIKRLNPHSNQGVNEFRTEIEMLSKLRHVHLVSLIGYCNDDGEMILLYEYMSNGTLQDHLYSRRHTSDQNPEYRPPLPWKERLMICIGAARGLHYLHSGAMPPIIHRDVKSSNILLDEKWTAKVSDFGLSRVGPTGDPDGPKHVSTMVKGSYGYLDPEYYRMKRLTDKSDVYSFGVVLFEVLCSRPAMNATLPKDQVNLAIWVRSHVKSGTLDAIVDPKLTGQIAPECLKSFGELAEMCVRDNARERPSMGDVVWGLEFALELQMTDEKSKPINIVGSSSSGQCQGQGPDRLNQRSSNVGEVNAILDNDVNGNTGSGYSVFSEIIDPQGR